MTAPQSLDELLGPRDIERTFKKTRRWISELVKRGEFPPPDKAGSRGSPNQWRRSTIERHLDAIAPRRDTAA